MNTRRGSCKNSCKDENYRWIPQKFDLHTLFTPLSAKSVNLVYKSCDILTAIFSRFQNRNIPCVTIHPHPSPALPIGRHGQERHDATRHRVELSPFWQIDKLYPDESIRISSESIRRMKLKLRRLREQGSSYTKIRSYLRRWESTLRPPTCG